MGLRGCILCSEQAARNGFQGLSHRYQDDAKCCGRILILNLCSQRKIRQGTHNPVHPPHINRLQYVSLQQVLNGRKILEGRQGKQDRATPDAQKEQGRGIHLGGTAAFLFSVTVVELNQERSETVRENNGFLLFLAIVFGVIGIALGGSGIAAIIFFVLAVICVVLYLLLSFGIIPGG